MLNNSCGCTSILKLNSLYFSNASSERPLLFRCRQLSGSDGNFLSHWSLASSRPVQSISMRFGFHTEKVSCRVAIDLIFFGFFLLNLLEDSLEMRQVWGLDPNQLESWQSKVWFGRVFCKDATPKWVGICGWANRHCIMKLFGVNVSLQPFRFKKGRPKNHSWSMNIINMAWNHCCKGCIKTSTFK